MDFFRKILGKAKEFFTTRWLGFYFTAALVVLSFVQLIIYAVAFSPVSWESYKHWTVIFFAVLAIVCGAVMPFFRVTAPWSAAAATLMEFLSFLMFVRYGYMYFSQIFFGGVSISLFFQMYYGYLASLILYVLCFAIGIAAIFLKQERKTKKTADVAVAEGGKTL